MLNRKSRGCAALVAVAVACGPEAQQDTPRGAPPVIFPVETLAGYAQACGQELGQVPAVDCSEATAVPLTNGGAPIDDPSPTYCDFPSPTNFCTTARVGRIRGERWDGTADPDVDWAFICRTLESDPLIALIGHNRRTGGTCFFESTPGLEGSALPAPLSDYEQGDARDDVWLDPAGVAEVNCPRCHDADPWVHSPFIDQVRDPYDPSSPLVPSGADPDRPYYAIASPFEDWQPTHLDLPGNECLQCHRVGTGEIAELYVRWATNRLPDAELFRTAWGSEWPRSHWMPPGGERDQAAWNALYGPSVDELLTCFRAESTCSAPLVQR